MNKIDQDFYNLVKEIKSLTEMELYHRIRLTFEQVPAETKESMATFFNEIGYWGKLDHKNNNYEELELKTKELYNHIDDLVWFYRRLGDYRSKKTLYAIISNWYQYDFTSTKETKEECFDEYFDFDLLKCSEEEVFVDLGSYTGDTVLSYLKNYGQDCYKKIYCYEITPKIFEILKDNVRHYKNIECRQKGISDIETSMNLLNYDNNLSTNTLEEKDGNIEVTTLDIDISEKITLLKADIEGFEQKMIEGAKNHIKNDHPKLLISIYHKNEDLWKIPKMIDEINPNYKFYLRYKSSIIYPTEITLYAI